MDGEVVTADSMQVYRGLDIGTDKPTPAQRQGVPHHLIDVVEPDQRFNVAEYRKLAHEAIARDPPAGTTSHPGGRDRALRQGGAGRVPLSG